MSNSIAIVMSVVCILCSSVCYGAEGTRSLLSNGDFETAHDDKPAGWGLGAGATWEKEGANHFLRLKVSEPGRQVMVFRSVALEPEVKALELKFKTRYEDIQ